MELPPRARRIRSHTSHAPIGTGTTSACAENTRGMPENRRSSRNYLRVRGEYIWVWKPCTLSRELPPRARRIPTVWLQNRHKKCELPPRARRIPGHGCCIAHNQGTTSACAENTQPPKAQRNSPWNYLRVRGEYVGLTQRLNIGEELPPRARRILEDHLMSFPSLGTTSACAENTPRSGW